ncbi:hypothetical protein [Nocardioides convexus]|uniref:hypothetical protein n=1 Tax=Nocardioides convexus TaxID=2712224 RepID=UPI00241849E0|nr:hypothetical protein [Nocardioides convexus]
MSGWPPGSGSLLAPPPPPRRATKPSRGSKERRLEAKRQRGQTKQAPRTGPGLGRA